MIKTIIKLIFHKVLGIERSLFYFSLFKIRSLKNDKNEKDIFLFIEQLNNHHKEGIVLDVGANIGITTGVLSNQTNFFIHAFEPLPLNYHVFEKVIDKLKIGNRVRLHKIALGNYEGYCDMVLPVLNNVKQHGLTHVIDPTITAFNDGEKATKIPINKLDNLFKNEIILGIKLDVENFEFEVLKGREHILKLQKPIIYIELWDNENRQNCFRYLRGLGYQSYYCKEDKLVLFEDNIKTVQTFIFK